MSRHLTGEEALKRERTIPPDELLGPYEGLSHRQLQEKAQELTVPILDAWINLYRFLSEKDRYGRSHEELQVFLRGVALPGPKVEELLKFSTGNLRTESPYFYHPVTVSKAEELDPLIENRPEKVLRSLSWLLKNALSTVVHGMEAATRSLRTEGQSEDSVLGSEAAKIRALCETHFDLPRYRLDVISADSRVSQEQKLNYGISAIRKVDIIFAYENLWPGKFHFVIKAILLQKQGNSRTTFISKLVKAAYRAAGSNSEICAPAALDGCLNPETKKFNKDAIKRFDTDLGKVLMRNYVASIWPLTTMVVLVEMYRFLKAYLPEQGLESPPEVTEEPVPRTTKSSAHNSGAVPSKRSEAGIYDSLSHRLLGNLSLRTQRRTGLRIGNVYAKMLDD